MGNATGRVDRRYNSPFHPRLALTIAKAAYANAAEYLTQAQLLQRHDHAGRAQALAILGHEELGKAVYFALFALGVLADKPFARQQMFRQHGPKQAMSRTTRLVASAQPDFVDLLPKQVFTSLPSITGPPTRGQIREFDKLLDRIKVAIDSQPKAASVLTIEIGRRAVTAMRSNLSRPREGGFYVELDEHRQVVSPHSISRKSAAGRIRTLRLDLRRSRWIAETPPSLLALARRLGRRLRVDSPPPASSS